MQIPRTMSSEASPHIPTPRMFRLFFWLHWRSFLARVFEPPQNRSISWIVLPPSAPEPSTPFPDFAPPSLVLPFPNIIVEPAAPVVPVPTETPRSSQAPPATQTPPRAPNDSAILGTLGRSLGCNLLNYEKLSHEEKERCIARLAKVQDEPAATYAATDDEKRIAQQFARELAVKQAPPLLPCFSSVGLGISIKCLMLGAFNGFNFAGAPSYADAPGTDK